MRLQQLAKWVWYSLMMAFVVIVIVHMSVPEGSLYFRQSQQSDLRPVNEFRNDTEKLQMEIERLKGELQAMEFILTKSQQDKQFGTLLQQAYIQKRGRMEELKAMKEFVVNSLRK